MTENQKNIERIFKDHYQEFCLLSCSYVSCMDQAQDIVQEVFVRLLIKDEVSPILNLKGYIWKSVKNNSLKQLGKSRRLDSIDKKKLVIIEEVENENRELDFKIKKALNQLPPQCKIIFELCTLDGYKYQAAADSLGISINTVKTQMKKAYRVMRNNLSDVYLTLFFMYTIFLV